MMQGAILYAGVNQSAAVAWVLTALYLGVLLIASVYGLHRYWLVVRYYRTRHRRPNADDVTHDEDLPHVTVQLPMFNERSVAERVIDAACKLDYPADKLQIQVLDDSTDESASIAERCVEKWRLAGVDIEYLHRTNRTGYKAGALQEGLNSATGELIAVFDADFVPSRDYLRRVVHHFSDPQVGMVQAAWDHINRTDSLLTRCQAIYLDSHFQIEHAARHRDGNWFNFNGTAGIWRRDAIETAGGWQHDTLTEDMDLSYRAQLAGWQFIYRQDVDCPAELPPETIAFKTQQHRWTKGTVQTAMKLLLRILRSDASRGRKIEAAFHLTSPIVYPCVILIALLMLPAVLVNLKPFEQGTLSAGLFGLMILLLATASGVTFYVAGQIERRAGFWRTLVQVPPLIALGVGMSVNNTIAVIEALLGRQSAFVRTPKFNRQGAPAQRADARKEHGEQPEVTTQPRRGARFLQREVICIALELTLGAYLLVCLTWAFASGPAIWTTPFLMLFATGYLFVGMSSIRWSRWWTKPSPSPVKSVA
jgi:cellulose synthase/poly-beta-1,6-N-acetylglucosamine synthase-like glycosyltransferase